jgi:hypothetical protein
MQTPIRPRLTNRPVGFGNVRLSDRRGGRRQAVTLTGTIYYGSASADCTIRDLSETGALIHAPSVKWLPNDLQLLIAKEHVILPARRVWSRAPEFGIAFK